MTADADASTRAARRGRSPFELLRFTATPVPGALVLVEIEGRVAAAPGRFARRPVLVVEPTANRPRLELAPARATLEGDRWQAAYAIPAEAYDAARFALGLRGTLLDLPAPDEPTAQDRQTRLAREANALRRQLEAAEAAGEAARAEATATAGELGAAVAAARDEALAESAERIAALERDLAEAHQRAVAETAELRAAHEAALAEKDRALEEATARHEAALVEKDRALEEATARHEAAVRAASEAHGAEVERLRAAREEGVEEQVERRRAAAAEEGIGVLRAELAEERERSRARIAELEQELVAATSRLEALRRTAETDDDPTHVLRDTSEDDPDRTRVLGTVAEEDDPDRTRALGAVPESEDEKTRPFTAHEERGAMGERVLPLERGALPRSSGGRGPGAWVAVAALVGFVLVLLILLGFLG